MYAGEIDGRGRECILLANCGGEIRGEKTSRRGRGIPRPELTDEVPASRWESVAEQLTVQLVVRAAKLLAPRLPAREETIPNLGDSNPFFLQDRRMLNSLEFYAAYSDFLADLHKTGSRAYSR